MNEERECLTDLCFLVAQQAHSNKLYGLAEHWYNRGLGFTPDNTEMHYSMSYICINQKRFEEAAVHCTYAMRGQHSVMAQYNRALCLLMLGKYKQGFIDYDARLDLEVNRKYLSSRFGTLPYWEGQSCDTLLVCAEQGFGDIFQFSRFVPLIAEKFNVKKVIFEVPEACVDLFAYNFNSDTVSVVATGGLCSFDYFIQLISLCRVFDVRLDTIPTLKLNAQPEYVKKWDNMKGMVGLATSGRKDDGDPQVKEWNDRRSVSYLDIEPLYETGADLYDLKGLTNWSDTAGIMANLDMLITVDTGPAHLAGAMQIPTKLLNHGNPCWRWGLSGKYTPWYTTQLQQYRQVVDGDWSTPINELAGEIKLFYEKAA